MTIDLRAHGIGTPSADGELGTALGRRGRLPSRRKGRLKAARTKYALTATVLVATGLLASPASAGTPGPGGPTVGSPSAPQWQRSRGSLPISSDWMLAVKMDDRHIMWVGGRYANPVDARRAFIYDIRTQQFREVAPVPFAKATTDVAGQTPMMALATIGALADGSVVIVGGGVSTDPKRASESRRSYRYLPWQNTWVRTGDLPEQQQFIAPTVALPHNQLLAAEGAGIEALTSPAVNSIHAFVYRPEQAAVVAEVDPTTGQATGRNVSVKGAWSYTRTSSGAVSDLSQPHFFGNLVRLHDGRVLALGGHVRWDLLTGGTDISELATHTDFYDPKTGRWSQGPLLPPVAGEDDQLAGSHGGRTNGVCVAALSDNRVLIAGGATQTDGESYFGSALVRQSILVLTPAANPGSSHFRLSPHPIPSGVDAGGLFGGPGRNQLPCYVLTGDRVLLAGGETTFGEDLYDTYLVDTRTLGIVRGPDLLHGVAEWAQDPSNGYPADYQTGLISTAEVNVRNSQLVFDGRIVVHGGGYNGLDFTQPGVPYVEQLDLGRSGH